MKQKQDVGSLCGDDELRGQMRQDKLSLKIVPGAAKRLSKNQQAFNRLTKRIEQLQEIIRSEGTRCELLLKVYAKEIPARQKTLAERQLQVAKALGETTRTIKYTRRQMYELCETIQTLCEEAFEHISPDSETEAFYDAWSDSSYREAEQEQREMMKRIIGEQAKDFFGIDIDMADLDPSTPEGMARLAKRIQEQQKEQQEMHQQRQKVRKKTKKQLEQEEREARESELTLKSLRGIYLSLAKALHPDTITDPAEKARKEELMKRVTAAYTEKDLATLLKLEMEWIQAEGRSLDTLPDDQLKLYIASLKEQVEALEQERRAVQMHPRFMPIIQFSDMPDQAARREIRKWSHGMDVVVARFEQLLSALSKPSPRREVIRFLNEYRDPDPFDDFIGDIPF